jgi:extracellular matrix regulatory protein A
MERTPFILIGFGNLVSAGRIIAVVAPDSAPVKRLIQEARDRGSLIDATTGKKTRSVLVMDSDHLILSALPVDELAVLLSKENRGSGR